MKAWLNMPLEDILRDVDCGVMLLGPNAEILHANEAALRILGVSPSEAQGATSYEPRWGGLHGDGTPFPGADHPVPTAIRTKLPVRNVEMGVLRGSEREHVWISVSAIPQLDDDGNVVRVVCSFSDITTRREALLALRREADLLQEVMKASVAGICVLDPQGSITYANPAAEQILGLSRGEIVGRSYGAPEWRSTALDGSPWPDEQQPFVRVMKTKAPVVGVQHAIEWPDGHRHILSINGAPVLTADGEVESLVFAVLDITEQHRLDAERQSMQLQMQQIARIESLSVLAGGVAHDFNNLLASILGSASLALEILGENHPASEHVRLVDLAGKSAAELTRQLLAYSGRGRFVIRLLDTETILLQMDQLLRALVGKRVEVRLELSPNLPAIEGDQTQIQQIVMNLAINAAEAMSHAGSITIRTGQTYLNEIELRESQLTTETLTPGNYVFLDVTDTGPGIDMSVLGHIFDPFFTTKEKGHGLGLSAVLGIMKSHGGLVVVKSDAGKGTTFRLAFPDRGQVVRRAATIIPAPPLEITGVILVVDDEPFVRTLIERILRRKGCRVVSAKDGTQALELFRKYHGELSAVLLDLSMPGIGGRAVLETIRQLDQHMPVVLMSGYYEDDAAIPTGDSSCVFVQKPFAPAHLTSELLRLVEAQKR